MNLVYLIFNLCLGVPIAIIGIVTSSISLGFFWNDSTTSPGTRILLFCVSLADVGYLSLLTFYRLGVEAELHTTSLKVKTVFAVTFYGLNICEISRNWFLVMLGLERLLFFLRPFQFPQRWTPTAVGSTVAGVAIFAMAVRVPALLMELPNVSLEKIRIYNMAHLVVECVFLSILPVVLMIILFVATKVQVYKTALKHEEICSESCFNAKRMMGILQTILVTFIAFSLPYIPSSILHFYCQMRTYCTSTTVKSLEASLSAIASFFSILGSTSNFFIYILQSQCYRRRLIQMFNLQRFRWCRSFCGGGGEEDGNNKNVGGEGAAHITQ